VRVIATERWGEEGQGERGSWYMYFKHDKIVPSVYIFKEEIVILSVEGSS